MKRPGPVDLLLVALLFLLLGAAGFLLLQRQAVAEGIRSAGERERRLRTTLEEVRARREELQREWQALQGLPPPRALPGRAEALQLGYRLLRQTYDLRLTLAQFQAVPGLPPEGVQGLEALDYALQVQGDVESLLRLLDGALQFPTIWVQDLTLLRGEGEWVLGLAFTVLYQGPPLPAEGGGEAGGEGG